RTRKRSPAVCAERAAKAWPRCRRPVGLGAKRVTIMGSTLEFGGRTRSIVPMAFGSKSLSGPRLPPARGNATHLVVLCHGYGADGNDLIGLAPHWQRALPTVAFVAPNAPEPCAGAPSGYQWFAISRGDPGEMQRGVEKAAGLLDAFLDAELERLKLP